MINAFKILLSSIFSNFLMEKGTQGRPNIVFHIALSSDILHKFKAISSPNGDFFSRGRMLDLLCILFQKKSIFINRSSRLNLKWKWKWKSLSLVLDFLQPHGLEWEAFSFWRGSSQPGDRTQVSHVSGRFFTSWATALR